MTVSAPHSFGTAEAAAFAAQVGATRDTSAVLAALQRCADDFSPTLVVGAEALAAAEIVAASLGEPSTWLPATLAQWLSDDPPPFDASTVDVALRAVVNVLSDDSELCGLGYRDVGATWGDSVTDLRRRLGGPVNQGRSGSRPSPR